MTFGVVSEVAVDPVVWVEFRCPSCGRYVQTLPLGTPVLRGYCSRCSKKYTNQVAR